MDFTSLIAIAVAVVVIYFFIKLIVGPLAKAVVGIIIFLVTVLLLQRFFGFNFDQVLAPFGVSLNLNQWISKLNWILGPADYYIDQIKHFAELIFKNIPKSPNKW